MSSRVFLFLLLGLSVLAAVTSPSFLSPFLRPEVTPTATAVTPTPTATATPTPDMFAGVPVATPLSQGAVAFQPLPVPSLGTLPSTFTPGPTPLNAQAETALNLLVAAEPATQTGQIELAGQPTPDGPPPDRLYIPRLNRDLPVEAVGMAPSALAPGIFEWGVPDHRAAGWLNRSAPFGAPGNTVLAGHHNIKGEAFRDLWTLQKGDEITLYAGGQSRAYRVSDVLILPEKNQPLDVRVANAHYIQPTSDERLTLITCWPYESNSHRVVVIALPKI